jgi:hypothetical protein
LPLKDNALHHCLQVFLITVTASNTILVGAMVLDAKSVVATKR